MHELSVIEGILRTVIPAAEKAGAERILAIRLKIGEFSGIEPVCMEEYMGIAAKGTIAEGAVLQMRSVPARLKCLDCSCEADAGRRTFRCPSCGSERFRITGGAECIVENIEVE